MQSNRINFTKHSLDSLPLPSFEEKRKYYYDAKMRGLTIAVFSSGVKTFVLYRKIQNRPERISIGRYPDLTIEQARGRVAELNSKIAKGDNPAQDMRVNRSEMTLEELFTEYMERHAKIYKKSWQEDMGLYKRYLLPLSKKKISYIRKAEIQTLHGKIGKEHGTYGANRMLALLNTVFSKAIAWGWEKPNPAKGVQKFPEKERERFLQPTELPRFFRALSEEANETARDYILLSLLTGARKSNVLSMRWDQINFEQATWTIPDTKSGIQHTVPLTEEAITILKKRISDAPYVFPGAGKEGHFREPKKAWKRILQKANISDLRPHDLRRSLGSWQAATGASLIVIGKTLAHKNVNTTAIYARLNIDPVRDAMEKATSAMLSAGGLIPKGEIVSLGGLSGTKKKEINAQ